MALIVLDLEYNQPSRRIIQIGAVEVRAHEGEIEPVFCEHVNPGEPLDAYIQKLTGITQEQASRAQTLDHVAARFWRTIGHHEHIVLGGWGDDARKLVRDSHRAKVLTPEAHALDLTTLWKLLQTLGEAPTPKNHGLKRLMRYYGVRFEGQQHDALTDARATGEVLMKMAQAARDILG